MIWYTFWWLAVIAIFCSLTFAIILSKNKRAKAKPIAVLFAGVFISAVLLIFPIYKISFNSDWGSTIKALVISVQNTIQFFTADSDFALITDNIVELSGWLKEAYSLLGAFLIIVSPLLTFGFVLTFFRGLSARIKHFLRLPRETYVFSEINSRSVSLAESICQEKRKSIIAFTNAPKEDDKIDDDLLNRVRKLGGIVYSKDISLVKIPWLFVGKEISFFTICEDETESISETLQLVDKYKTKLNIRIYLFSHSIESELMLNNIDKGNIRVRRVNPVNSLVNHILISDGKNLFDTDIRYSNGEKVISAMVVGMGVLGKEMFKALSWYCQMDNYKLNINTFDKITDLKERMLAICPELLSDNYNRVCKDGEAYYDINMHSCDVETETFKNIVRNIRDISYVFISLGNDTLNIETAVNLRVLFEQMHIKPRISAIVSNPEKRVALCGARDKNGEPYDINFIGDAKTIYSAKVILNSDVEKEALELHKRYNNGNPYGFYEFEYNYKSSMASVIHYEARKYCKIAGAGKRDEDLTDYERETIESLEHKRWNAYMRSEGFIFSGSKSKESRNDMGKMHHNLVVYGDLIDEDKRKDSRVGAM